MYILLILCNTYVPSLTLTHTHSYTLPIRIYIYIQIAYHQQSIQTWTALLSPIKTATLATTSSSSSSSSHYAAHSHPAHTAHSEVADGKPHTNLLQTASVPNRPAVSGNLNLKNGFGASVNGHHNSDHTNSNNNNNTSNTQVQQQSTQTINNQLVNKAGEYNKQLKPITTHTTTSNNNNNNNSNTTIDLLSADFPFYDGAESSFFQSPATARAGAPPTSTGHNYDPYTDDNNTLIMTSNDSYADITSYINDISNTTTTTTNTNNTNNNNNNKGTNKKDKGRNKKSGSVSEFTDA